MKLRIDEIATAQDLNLSQVQRLTGLTMSQTRRYWYNKTGSVEMAALTKMLALFRQKDPALTIGDLFAES